MKGNDLRTRVRTTGHGMITVAVTAVFLIALVGGTSAGQAAAATATTFSGRAFAAQATVLGITAGPVSDTGEASPTGDAREAAVLEYPISGVIDPTGGAVTAEVLHTAVIAHGNTSSAEASVANVTVNAGGQTVAADFLMARASAKCNGNSATSAGSSEIVGLKVNGNPTTVGTAPNQTIPLPLVNGKIVINEQTTDSSASSKKSGMTVNAIHVIVPGVADVIVASARAGVACGTSEPTGCPNGGFVTGGGWINSPSDPQSKANFAVAGGMKNGGWWGHLLYIDHGTGMKVKGTGVTDYYDPAFPSLRRVIKGTADIDGNPGYYTADVTDRGEPGRGNDTFILTLTRPDGSVYKAGGDDPSVPNLEGGNIQLHCK